MPETVVITREDPIAIVQIDRPQVRNALNEQVITEIGEAMKALDDDPAVRCIVLTGDEKAFAAGADIKAAFVGATVGGQFASANHATGVAPSMTVATQVGGVLASLEAEELASVGFLVGTQTAAELDAQSTAVADRIADLAQQARDEPGAEDHEHRDALRGRGEEHRGEGRPRRADHHRGGQRPAGHRRLLRPSPRVLVSYPHENEIFLFDSRLKISYRSTGGIFIC